MPTDKKIERMLDELEEYKAYEEEAPELYDAAMAFETALMDFSEGAGEEEMAEEDMAMEDEEFAMEDEEMAMEDEEMAFEDEEEEEELPDLY